MSSQALVLLPQGAGYGVTIGLGLVFGIGMILVSRFLSTYMNERSDHSEMTAIIWTAAQGYLYGIAAGCTIQIALMTVLAIHAKVKIPNGHTVLEIIKLRYGTAAHGVFIFLCLVTNILAVTSMILGASGVITALTGMHVVASTFLLPLGVVIYTVAGGLKATFLTDYIHTTVVMVLLCFLTIRTFNNPAITGLESFYDVLIKRDETRSISGNYRGSALTFKSKGAVIFGLVHSLGDFALVIMDTSFWQKGFAADTGAAMVGTTAGLAAIGLESSSIFPTYPRASIEHLLLMTTAEINAGYVLPYTCMAVAGKGGAFALLLVVFMCVTSTVSAQLIAVSSISSFDIYRTYINPHASDKQIIRVSHWSVLGFGIFAPAFATALHYGGIDLNWMGYFLATIICPGMFPMAFTILWKKQSKAAVIIAPLAGLASGIAVWIGTAYVYAGGITVLSLEGQLPCLWGALTSTFSSAIYSIPQDFDWRVFLLLNEVHEDKTLTASEPTPSKNGGTDAVRNVRDLESVVHPFPPAEINRLKRAAGIASIFSVVIGLLTWVVWPLPLYRDYIFTKPFFMGWTVVSEIWLFFCLIVAVVYPLVDGRDVLAKAGRLAWGAITGTGKEGKEHPPSSSTSTPESLMSDLPNENSDDHEK
ncbi:putative urea active transporter 1 [Lachnellula cervina]|uniref:Putative urea active transporter 1 n=1 Tax=Lachnellula cervina TaxID=1316786 RepID=A0A7D8YX33_9HELO|nr:putative urea active transporter 1 [Lachnellula cervina]